MKRPLPKRIENMMTKEAIKKEDVLFHPVHGLCRVSDVKQSFDKERVSYTLLPVNENTRNIRFVFEEDALMASKFNKLISTDEADVMLDYLKGGKRTVGSESHAWEMVELILEEATTQEPVKDQRRRQRLNQAVAGFAHELALVLQITLKEACNKIQSQLRPEPETSVLVLNAITKASEEVSW